MQLTIPDDGRERLLLDARRPQLDALQHARVQNVDAGVDAVAHEFHGLLHEAVDARRVALLVHHDAVFGRLFHLGDDDGAFLAVGLVEGGEGGEGVVADDVRVEDEEGGRIFAEGFGGEFEGAGGAEGFVFDGEFDADVVFFFVLDMQRIKISGNRCLLLVAIWTCTPLIGERGAYLFEGCHHDIRPIVDC